MCHLKANPSRAGRASHSESPRSGSSIDLCMAGRVGGCRSSVTVSWLYAVGGAAVVRSWAETVIDVEGGLVLGEPTGGGIPLAGVGPGSGPGAEHGDDGFRLLVSGDAGADVQVLGDLVVEVADVGFDVGPSSQHGPGFGGGSVEVGEGVVGGGEVPLGVGEPVGEVSEVSLGGGDLVLVAPAVEGPVVVGEHRLGGVLLLEVGDGPPGGSFGGLGAGDLVEVVPSSVEVRW